MKIGLSTKFISVLGIILLLLVLLHKMNFFRYYAEVDYFKGAYSWEKRRIDTLNERLFSAKSTLQAVEREKQEFTDGKLVYGGWHFNGLGVGKLTDYSFFSAKKLTSCIAISSLKLKIDEEIGPNYLSYYTKNNQGFISRSKMLKTKDYAWFSFKDEKVGYLYSVKDEQFYIPIGKNVSYWLLLCGGMVYLLFGVAIFLFAVISFFRFLWAIANNRAFDDRNVSRLRNISLAALLTVVVPYIVDLLTYFWFTANYGSDLVMLKNEKSIHWELSIMIFFYLLYIAFKRGVEINNENQLTI